MNKFTIYCLLEDFLILGLCATPSYILLCPVDLSLVDLVLAIRQGNVGKCCLPVIIIFSVIIYSSYFPLYWNKIDQLLKFC